jgi:hypothetical protein
MAKSTTRRTETATESTQDESAGDLSNPKPVALERKPEPHRACVSFRHQDRVEITLDSDTVAAALSRLIGCALPASIAALTLTPPRAGGKCVLTCRTYTAAEAEALAASVGN